MPPGMLEDSSMVRELACNNLLELTDCRRSDAALFGFYTSLRVNGQWRSLAEALAEARDSYRLKRGYPDYSLVISHKRREEINARVNRAKKPRTGAVHVPYRPAEADGESPAVPANRPQSCWLWAGMELVGAGRKCKKGLFYTLKSSSLDEAVLECMGVELKMSTPELVRSCRLPHALTYSSSQGLTLKGRVRLCDTHWPHFTTQHLYIGSSRATSNNLLDVC